MSCQSDLEQDYARLRGSFRWEDEPDGDRIAGHGIDWSLRPIWSLAPEDRRRAAEDLRQQWANPVFRWLAMMLPLLLIDEGAKGLHEFSEGADGRWRRQRLCEFLLEETRALPGEEMFPFSRLLLQRLRFYDLWQLYVASPSSERDLWRDRCRQAQREWIAAMRSRRQAGHFETWVARWAGRYRGVLAQVAERHKEQAELLFPQAADREREVLLALFERPDEYEGWRFCDDAADFDYVDGLIRRWFLPRYDLEGANRVVNRLCQREAGITGHEGGGRRLWAWLREPGIAGGHRWVAGAVGALAWLTPFVGLLAAVWEYPWASALAPWLVGAFVAAAALWFALLGLRFVTWNVRALYAHVPRLAGATLLGLAAGLLNIGGFGEFALQAAAPANRWPAIILAIAAVMLTFFYLHWEVGTPPLRREVRGPRVSALFWLGLTQALTFSSLFSWLLAGRLFDPQEVARAPVVRVGGPLAGMGLGAYYPTLAILFAFASLAVGVVLQILWQEQPMTDPEVAAG